MGDTSTSGVAGPAAQGSSASQSAAATRSVIARDPGDLTSLLWFLLVAVIGVLAAWGGEQTTAGFEGDIVQLVSHLPDTVITLFVVGLAALHLLLFLGIPLLLAVLRRWRRLGIYTLGWITTIAVLAAAETAIPSAATVELPDFGQTLTATATWPPSGAVATAVAALVLLSPRLSRSWRHFGWVFVALIAVQRIVTSTDVVLDIILAVGIGGSVGYALLLAFGRRVTFPAPIAVKGALSRIDIDATAVHEGSTSTRGSLPFTAELAGGGRSFCKVLASGQYEADSLLRRYRRVRVKQLGEDVAFSSPRRAASVEAMLSTAAARSGVRTPNVLGVAPVGPDGAEMVIAFEHVGEASALDACPPDRVTDDVIDQAWRAVRDLRRADLAHRDLQLANWLLDGDGRLWLIDFSYGEPAASDGALGADIAELLSATYAAVGADRAVAGAIRALGADTVATGLSYLVPAALTRPTRAAAKAAGGLEPLINQTALACGVDEPEFAPIERVKPRTLIMAGFLALAVYVLLPQLADVPRMIDAIRDADLRFALAALIASVVTYIGSGMALTGASPAPLRLWKSMLAAVAAAFTGAVAPPGVAHVGLNVRYYQKQGMTSPVAVSSTAAKEVGVGSVHIVLLLLLALVAGRSGVLQDELDKLPSSQTIAIVVAVLIGVVGMAAAVPKVRRVVIDSVVPAVKHSLFAMKDLVSRPSKMLMLFTGALLLQMGFIAALYLSVQALGADVGIVTIALIYLTVGSAAAVAPTPGGVGAVEAVLLAALTGVGVDSSTALAAVFLYRLVTFWVPIPIGGISLRYMVSRDML